MRFPFPSIALLLCLAAGCASKDSLTAKAVGCKSSDVKILPSEYKRQGVETAWCAQCAGKRYQCVTNPERSKVQCVEAREGTTCY
jgi:hypothetical protein